jgi:hypothetical protein
VHVPKEKRNKMDKKEVKCIFIGYKDGMKGYKLWDPASRKIMYSSRCGLQGSQRNFQV